MADAGGRRAGRLGGRRAGALRERIHACAAADLPYWLNTELWEVELAGAERGNRKLVARRGRLLRRLDAWNGEAVRAFAESCAERTTALAAANPDLDGYAADTAARAAEGGAAVNGFIAARAAEIVGGPAGYDRERAAQAEWLAARLGLAADAGA